MRSLSNCFRVCLSPTCIHPDQNRGCCNSNNRYKQKNKWLKITESMHNDTMEIKSLTVCWNCSSKLNVCWLTPGAQSPRWDLLAPRETALPEPCSRLLLLARGPFWSLRPVWVPFTPPNNATHTSQRKPSRQERRQKKAWWCTSDSWTVPGVS